MVLIRSQSSCAGAIAPINVTSKELQSDWLPSVRRCDSNPGGWLNQSQKDLRHPGLKQFHSSFSRPSPVPKSLLKAYRERGRGLGVGEETRSRCWGDRRLRSGWDNKKILGEEEYSIYLQIGHNVHQCSTYIYTYIYIYMFLYVFVFNVCSLMKSVYCFACDLL